jgi:hypothetical protein
MGATAGISMILLAQPASATPAKRSAGRPVLGMFEKACRFLDRRARGVRVRALRTSATLGRRLGSYSASDPAKRLITNADLSGLRDLFAQRMSHPGVSFAQAFFEVYVEHRPATMSREKAERQARDTRRVRRWQMLLKRRGFYPSA